MNDILHYKGYYASIHFNADENTFYGKIQGIAETILFDARSLKELKAVFLESVEEYIDSMNRSAGSTEENGIRPDTTKDTTS
ncbi:hypothetical protein LZZ85_01115 [Terrimonas sp. NA20]|uniref:Antitoxin HicB n=1 Tax=Terrimonas ginsenosidimutans TaxID=2908004 RepID=A0ABS9KKJ9_9BACT|nr:hypothetical protein [Terrimonas ginsenosidimutans]MCG2612850.1 hypothetical protein [Terrimonas ginsenosidimutans]